MTFNHKSNVEPVWLNLLALYAVCKIESKRVKKSTPKAPQLPANSCDQGKKNRCITCALERPLVAGQSRAPLTPLRGLSALPAIHPVEKQSVCVCAMPK